MLSSGLVLHTDYAGTGCPHMDLRMLSIAMRDFLRERGEMPGPLRDTEEPWQQWLIYWRACDNSRCCRDVLLNGKHAPEHFIPDLSSRLPREVQNKLSEMRPDPQAES